MATEPRFKRPFDLLVSGFLLTVLALPMGIVALIVRRSMGVPVLFRQVRPGRDGVPFELVKFRTMRAVAEADDPGTDAQRITRVGGILRATSLDELPELWNVLRGDMSLVGPRPLLMAYLPLYSREQARRHEVRPGITGWAQVNGRNSLTWEEKFALDIWYVDHQSLRLDVKILLRTCLTMMRPAGVSSSEEETMPRFTGSASSAPGHHDDGNQ